MRREGRNAPAALYARVHFCLHKSHARPRVQQAPGLPCALYFEGKLNSKPRTQCAARSRSHTQFVSRMSEARSGTTPAPPRISLRLSELQASLMFRCHYSPAAVGADDRKRRSQALPGHGIDAPAWRRLQHPMAARSQQRANFEPMRPVPPTITTFISLLLYL